MEHVLGHVDVEEMYLDVDPENLPDKGEIVETAHFFVGQAYNAHIHVVEKESGDILFPRELKAAHDSVAKTLKDKRTAEQEKAIAGSFDEWQKRYQYQSKELMMIPPHSAKEIVDEGAALHHCVRLYVKNVAEKKSVILFVRSVDEPDKSLCTVEVKDGQVTQARGFDNAEPPAQITAFIEQWKQRVLYASDKAAA